MHTMSRLDLRLRTFLFALVVSAAGVAPAAGADTATSPSAKTPAKAPAKAASAPPREGSLGKGTGALLTKDQLKQCMAEQDRMKQEGDDLVQTQAALAKTRSDIERLGSELDAEKATVDRSNQVAVDAYNERLRSRAKMIEDYKIAAPQFNQRVDKLSADRQGYAKDCADRRYLEEDYDAIKAGQ
jgi:hypothetical protein